jgi:uncharacterized membrane protein
MAASIVALAVSILVWLYAAYYALWCRFRDHSFQHTFFGACAVLLLLWSMRAGLAPGLDLHLLGVTTMTLMFGWQLTLIGLALVCIGVVLIGPETWPWLGFDYLTGALVPVLTSWMLFRWADRRLPNHFFVYLFVSVFSAAALSSVARSLVMAACLWLIGRYSFEQISEQYLIYIPLLAFPEAFVNGAIMIGMIALRPSWVITFDDRRYIRGK